MVKFGHIADSHLGAWKIPAMADLNRKAFEKALDACIAEKVDFLIIAGDFFDTALPAIEVLKRAAAKLKELKEKNIPCYLVPGSHDFSASGKTFLDVFEKAGLCVNLHSEEKERLELLEEKDFAIAGIRGKKAELEKEEIKGIKIPISLPKEKLKILVLHTTIGGAELEGMSAGISAEKLPGGFDYYALGHIHRPFQGSVKEKMIVYPGPLFPNNFSELEELGNGSFVIAEYKSKKLSIEKQEIKLKERIFFEIDATGKSPDLITSEALGKIKKEKILDKIVLLKISGTLGRGKSSEIDFDSIKKEAEKKDCYALLKNIAGLESPEFKIKLEVKAENIEEIEKEIVEKKEMIKDEIDKFIPALLKGFDLERKEGESVSTFEMRIADEINKIFGLEK